MVRYAVEVKGIVQGVGFRPFVYRLARNLKLCGFVRNTAEGVRIEIEGNEENCSTFLSELEKQNPPQSLIRSVNSRRIKPEGDREFRILSSSSGIRDTLVSPDIGLCADCAADIDRKGDRRYRYAFANCTNCGPRFTILRDIPYDRKNTSMADFTMCPDCLSEYENPLNRHFHAQPNACPACGPQLFFYRDAKPVSGDPYRLFQQAIDKGEIIALKGIGGFHLCCDARNEAAVKKLRGRKRRETKPLAVMMRDPETAEKYCEVSPEEKELLTSPQKPIVLLKKKKDCPAAPGITLLNRRIGVMLPYTPLHYILMKDREILVMTSANLSDDPMIFKDSEAGEELSGIADAMLTHNRRIVRRMDDSLCMTVDCKARMIRRARGYVPQPLLLEGNTGVILALGAQQKNTFCLAKGENAFLSGHIGDLDNPKAEDYLKSEIETFIRIFSAEPEVVVCDLHPDYFSTEYAAAYRGSLPVIRIQHHHAHFASVLAEQGIRGRAIGFIFDGTGYGTDGKIWGGEALFGTTAESRRMGHLLYFPLLGGDAAVREPWRCALSAIDMAAGRKAALALFPEHAKDSEILLRAGDRQIHSLLTSSMGRLFDAVSALTGVCLTSSYEGQAAVDLQQVMDESSEGAYSFGILTENGDLIFDWRPVIREALSDIRNGTAAGTVSARFHRAVVELVVSGADRIRKETGCTVIVLSGGVFQNDYLLENCLTALRNTGFSAFANEKVPAGDGGISFGQAAAASCRFLRQRKEISAHTASDFPNGG